MSDRLSAMDIEGQEFPKKLRGYAPEEVRLYLRSVAEELKEAARKEAELLIQESRMKGERLLEQAQDQLSRIEAEISRTRLERNSFDSRLRTILEEHIAMLDLREKEREDHENLRFMHRRSGSETG